MSPLLILLAITVMLVFIGGMYGLILLLNPTRTAADRLRDLQGGDVDEGTQVDLIVQQDDEGFLQKFGGSVEDRNVMRRKLVQAGYRHRHALEILNTTRIGLALGLPLMLIPVTSQINLMYGLGMTVGVILLGYWGPYMLVENALTKRKDEILKSFPDTLDLLVSSVEAGLGLDAAFRRVAAEMESAAPTLSKEFQLVNAEIGTGISRVDALRRMEKRTGVDEIRSLVNMLAQAERFGTSVAKSLRVHATVTRQKRMSKAEEEAAKVSPKLTVVMILTLLPVLGMVLMGPALIKVFRLTRSM